MSDFGVQLKDYNQQMSTLCNILLKTDTIRLQYTFPI
jgi:hypothetical protein